jgi:hypothetical protein
MTWLPSRMQRLNIEIFSSLAKIAMHKFHRILKALQLLIAPVLR